MVSSEAVSVRAFLVAAIAIAVLWTTPVASKSRDAADLCEIAVAAQERAHRIPAKLLHAISIAESGRWDDSRRETIAWPWTVTAEGQGRYFPTRATAIRAVRSLQRRGIRNIDVGCMQINLHYHPDAFRSLEEAFDPVANAAYGAGFLAKLRRERRSWVQAVKHYHSATRELHGPYREKVYRIWREARRDARREQIAGERRQRTRQASVTRRIHRMADRLLADRSFDARAQLWLENVAGAMLRNTR